MNTFEQRRGLDPLPHALISYSHGKCKCVHSFHSLSERIVHDKLIKEMVDNYIECSFHGWLFLSNMIDRQSCQLFNPVSMATIQLPHLSRTCYDYCALSCDPNDPNCIVIMIKAEDGTGMPRCYFCRPGDVLWNEKHLVLGDDYIRALGCYKGQICIFTLFNKIYLVAANPANLTLTDLGAELITRSPQHYERFHDYLVESDGELFVIQIFETRMDAYDFVVYKLDAKEKRFVAVNCLGGRAFFLSPFSLGISCSTQKYGVKANTIYFTESFDTRIFSFELQNRVLSFSLPCPNVESNFVHVEWILPLTPSPLCKVDNIAPVQIKNSTMKQPLVCISAGKYGSRNRVDINTNSVAKKPSSKFVGRDWSELPHNLLISVVENLSYVSCVLIATVCKSWGSAITWVPKKFSGCPIFLHMTSSSIELFHFMNGSSCSVHVEEKPEILSIEQAKYGWLLMTKYGGKEIFFLNPLTTEKIEIPNLPEDNICGLCFTSFPTSSNCSVLGISFHKINSGNTISFVYHIRRGEMKWTKVKVPQFDVNVNDFAFIPYGNPIFHKGVFYWIWGCGNLGAYDPTKGEVKFLDEPRSPCSSLCKSYLLESEEKLMSVWVEKHGKWIKVYQLDEASMSWEKVNTLDDKVVFLSPNSNMVIKMEGMEDMIIFNRFVNNQPLLYSLKTGELRVCGSEDYIIQDFCDISEYHIKSAWIKPNVKRHCVWELSWHVLFNISQLFVTD